MAQIEVIKTNGSIITKPARRFDPTETLAEYGGDWAVYRAAMETGGKDFWLPVVRDDKPLHDPETQHEPQPLPVSIQATQVVYGWAAPVPKTAQEIDDELTEIVDQIGANRDLTKGLALTLFDVLNMVRALEANPPITLAQFKSYVKGKM